MEYRSMHPLKEGRMTAPTTHPENGEARASALVVDDEKAVLRTMERLLEAIGVQPDCVETAERARERIGLRRFDIVFLDIHLGGANGLALLEEIKKADPAAPVIIVTGDTSSQLVIESMKKGAYDYLQKPFTAQQLRDLALEAIDARRRSRESSGSTGRNLPAADQPVEDDLEASFIVGGSPAMINLLKRIGLAARSDAPVLITGESGSGKELAARAVHDNSERADRPFVSINCAAIPEGLIESELFGHEKGSFTGAHQRQAGKFEQCGKGTLFLDEIGDMALSAQAKLLRVLQDGEFQRVGGSTKLKSEARIIAATNRDLEELVRDKRFRLDLYYRLNVVGLRIPSLRERPSDIEPLVDHFIRKYRDRGVGEVEGIESAALRALENYSWPGNVRQLESAVRKAIIFSRSKTLLLNDFKFLLEEGGGGVPEASVEPPFAAVESVVGERGLTAPMSSPPSLPGDFTALARVSGGRSIEEMVDEMVDALSQNAANNGLIYRAIMDRVERRLLTRALDRFDGNQSLTAKRLGISRNNLRAKLKEYGTI
jgi:DNA-binding NtrC family response regulator